MPAPVVLVTDAQGLVQDANGPARALFGESCVGQRACALFRHSGCTCAQSFARGEREVDLGCRNVRGISGPLAASALGEQRVLVFQPRGVGETCALTGRERDVLKRVALGDTDEEAGRALGIGVATVRTHLESARRKLGARTRSHAVARALNAGMLDTPG